MKQVLDQIKEKLNQAVGYLRDRIRTNLMSREFRKPAVTAEVYLNATLKIRNNWPHIYAKVYDEAKAIHETYFMEDPAEINR